MRMIVSIWITTVMVIFLIMVLAITIHNKIEKDMIGLNGRQ